MAEPFVRTEALRKIYKMGETEVKALDGVNLQINQGDYAVLMGPSARARAPRFT